MVGTQERLKLQLGRYLEKPKSWSQIKSWIHDFGYENLKVSKNLDFFLKMWKAGTQESFLK